MRNFLIIALAFPVVVLLSGCGSVPEEYPDDFGVTYSWSTGALPPKYTYQYAISIGPGMQGGFEYQPGYGEQGTEFAWRTNFALEEADLTELYQMMLEKDFFRSKWAQGMPLVGASNSSAVVQAIGKQYQIPNEAEMEQKDSEEVEEVYEFLRSLVPQEIWQEMESRQVQYESQFGEQD
ncbi:MAG TPA: hypothetical protein G4N92_02655 [Anaerolineae bacterium]|nr:hypothetical protein [Anaerolineae bacterium]